MKSLTYIGNYTFTNTNSSFKIYRLPKKVVSCSEAAFTKGIPLENELKTLILKTSNGLCTVNTRGDNKISLMNIKIFINVKVAFLLIKFELAKMNLKPGCVCPFMEQLWSLPLLIDEKVLELSFLSTNAGSREKCIFFSPNKLLLSPIHITNNFSK